LEEKDMVSMISRERVWKTLNHQVPDRVPLDFGSRGSGLALGAYEDLKRKLGVSTPTQVLDSRLGLAVIDESILTQFHIDTRYVYMKPSRSWNPRANPADDTFVDEWGATLKRPQGGFYYDHVGFPIKEPSMEAIKKHAWLDPDDPTRYEGLKEVARSYYERGYAVGSYMKGVFETTWILRGVEQAMMDLALEPKFFHALADKVSEVLSRMVENFLTEVGDYLQFFCITTDLGTQIGLMISPSAYKTFVRPYEKRIYEAIRKRSKAKVAQHSCGAIIQLIPDLIETGIDILNPIQTNAKGMDTALLKREFGKDLCFWGGIDAQKILPQGTPEEVEREVRRVVQDLSPGGGFLFAPSHDIQTFTPPENVVALYETGVRYGSY
jgi:uroporphyrinogen decarboxylase